MQNFFEESQCSVSTWCDSVRYRRLRRVLRERHEIPGGKKYLATYYFKMKCPVSWFNRLPFMRTLQWHTHVTYPVNTVFYIRNSYNTRREMHIQTYTDSYSLPATSGVQFRTFPTHTDPPTRPTPTVLSPWSNLRIAQTKTTRNHPHGPWCASPCTGRWVRWSTPAKFVQITHPLCGDHICNGTPCSVKP